jgi:hypothetical protein
VPPHPSLRTPHDLRLVPQQREPGRALNEIRLENRTHHPDYRAFTTVRSTGDGNIDPTLQGGLGPRSAEGPPSLPSLKSSGLLESWSASDDPPATLTQGQVSRNTTSNVRTDAQPPSRTSPSRLSYQTNSEPPRIVPSGMPVGMAWLANEATTSR